MYVPIDAVSEARGRSLAFVSPIGVEIAKLAGGVVQACAEKRDCFAKHQPGVAGCGWLQAGRNFLAT